ncbi:MAG: hypothetical protein ACI9B9_001258 [Halioglobus sp.]|jgi:hypothetical protein
MPSHTKKTVRSVVLHAHMFKNAGTTLDWSLNRCFGSRFVDHRDDKAMRESRGYIATYLAENTSIEALSSHWPPVPAPEVPGINVQMLMLLRNPLERSLSVYNFERSQPSVDSPGILKAKNLSFAQYIQWRLEPGTGPVVKNFHTRYCSGNYFGNDLDELYELAIGNLDNIPAVGLVDRYAESMVLFEYILQNTHPNIDLSWRSQNVSQTATVSTVRRIDSIAEELGDTFDALVKANEYDLRLSDYIQAKMDKALAMIPNLPDRLESIHNRNRLLK